MSSDEKDETGPDDLAEKLFGIEVNKTDDDTNVGSELLFDDYDDTSSIDNLLGITADDEPEERVKDDDVDFDSPESDEPEFEAEAYADEVDDDLILFSEEDDEAESDDDDVTFDEDDGEDDVTFVDGDVTFDDDDEVEVLESVADEEEDDEEEDDDVDGDEDEDDVCSGGVRQFGSLSGQTTGKL